MKYIYILPMFLLSFSIHASEICPEKMTRAEFTELLQETIEQFFPELRDEVVSVSTFKSDAYFLQTLPVLKIPIFRGKKKYKVELNSRILECPPSKEALRAILVHELEHIQDYSGWSSIRIAQHALHYVTSNKFRASYERATDMKVLEKGLSEGLADYRYWVYRRLSPKELKRKRCYYLTPEEILRREPHGATDSSSTP